MKWFFIGCLILFALPGAGQELRLLASRDRVSLRGLSVVNDQVVWVSGTGGTVGKSLDGGVRWTWYTVKGLENKDFRDIEAFDEKTAIVMAVDQPGLLLKTFNGGESWKLVYADSTKGMFLDAMEFWDNGNGMVVGDPIDGKIYVARSADFGNSWQRYLSPTLPSTDSGEAMFASSGTNIRRFSNAEAMVVSGGKRSRLLAHEQWMDMPILQGGQSTGANSMSIWNAPPRKPVIMVVGGDFTRDTLRERNCVYSLDLGKHWKSPEVPPHGYRSCVEFITGDRLICCGTSGVDISEDGGKTWTLVSREGFHVCRKAKSGKAVFLAGSGGRIARIF